MKTIQGGQSPTDAAAGYTNWMRFRHPLKRHLASAAVDAPEHLRVGTRPGRVFSKRCYVEAFAYADLHRGRVPLLCHGTVCSPEQPPFRHAWVELEGYAFDGVAQLFLPLADYHRLMAASDIRRYAPDEVTTWVTETRHAGPWE